jgi:predicted RNA-binding Zn-ribbon protein involved in translation (DUF1610 family)
MIKRCEVCGEEMTKLRDYWNFKWYWMCVSCGNVIKEDEEDGM